MTHGFDKQMLPLMAFHTTNANDLVSVRARSEAFRASYRRIKHLAMEAVEAHHAVSNDARIRKETPSARQGVGVGASNNVS